MNFKKRVNGSWVDTPHYIHNTSTDTLTTLPAVLYPNAVTATVGLKGNMEQSGTPVPTNPIQPQETGDRTGNLLDYTTVENTQYATATLITNGISISGIYYVPFNSVNFIIGQSYTMAWTAKTISGNVTPRWRFRYSDNTYSSLLSSGGSLVAEKEVSSLLLYVNTSGGSGVAEFTNIMLNLGSSPLPYEPYGYKIPILNNSQTTNVYLGEVQSTRRIKKLVLTGTETFGYANSCLTLSFDGQSSSLQPAKTIIICDRYLGAEPKYRDQLHNYQCCITRNYNQIAIRDDNYADTDAWKTYLQQQYAAGTPVTVWYVLATPETGIVNEPLMKIGDYADEVSGITIPTIVGANTISVDTTLQPSEVTATYKGWHPVADVHEGENGAWT